MAQTASQMPAQLRQLIFYHLDNDSVENANFLAGRLHALDQRNADSLHLLSLTYLRMGRNKAAYDMSQKYGMSGKNLGCAYVFALACERLGRYPDGITALEKAKALWVGRNHWNKHSDTSRKHLPDAAMAWDVLAKLWRGHGDLRRAGECFIESHKANPFIWDAFSGLCDIGADINVNNSFKMTPEMTEALPANGMSNGILDARTDSFAVPVHMANPPPPALTPANDPFTTMTKPLGDSIFPFPKFKTKSIFGSPPKAKAQPALSTPTANGTSTEDDDVVMGGVGLNGQAYADAPPAPTRRAKAFSRLGRDSSKDLSRLQAPSLKSAGRSNSDLTEGEESQSSLAQGMHKRTLSGHASSAASDASSAQPRRSNRLFGQSSTTKTSSKGAPDAAALLAAKREGELKKAKATGTKGRGPSTVGRVVSGNRKIMPPSRDDKESRAPSRSSVTIPPVPQKPTAEAIILPDTAAIEDLLAMFKQLGVGYSALARYDCKASIKAFEAVPTAQKDTAWVQAHLGKAYYEAAEYTKAEVCFARMMKIQPTRVEDTEYYSTVLWQLKKPVQLAYLAHTLRELDFEAPQTWCAVGNAFSLNREHDQAIGCFKRATQIDPNFYYAWTLMGHELLTNEEFDGALTAYRKGVGSERRGYASWYGLGKCYERMGKLEEAERHYRIAASINRQNSVLFVCIGGVLERLRHPREALVQFAHATSLAPNSALARFRKAKTLMTLQLYNEALTELNELRDLAPEEANVWYMLGRCHKQLKNRAEMVKCYTTSLNLDAKASQYIKEAMEAIDDSDEEEDSD